MSLVCLPRHPAVAYLRLVRSMSATTEIPRVEFLIATIVSILIAVAAPKGKRAMGFVGSLFAAIGIIFLAAGRIPQRWHGGPPVEGSFATFGALVMLVIGLYIIALAFFQSSRNHTPNDDTKQT